jgi:hypothetical protein
LGAWESREREEKGGERWEERERVRGEERDTGLAAAAGLEREAAGKSQQGARVLGFGWLGP